MQDIVVREIQPADNPAVAAIIRASLKEFGLDKPGTVYFDDTTDHLYELFAREKNSTYYVAEINGLIIGGAGIFPSDGLPKGTCELVKMYLVKDARGSGLGRQIINRCIAFAASKTYSTVYLETMHELEKAISVYQKFGFELLLEPMGNTGHHGCDVWMKKNL